ncbi:nucleoside triphosphate pyrophosphohydrolase [Ruminococcaceae bacterium OttesenSCG-928-D13]|nr:nucleoside triphosphate pyrophosphohydrolase [Ruminococcaceae bacterium OttesenSCG-928-D13]
MAFAEKAHYGIGDLVEIVRLLRQPDGCPWDREQTHASIRKSLIEETYEVADAIDRQDDTLLCEELGDLLLQVVMHAQMAGEVDSFNFEDVCDGICQKLIYRHPHVFGEMESGLSSGRVLANWEKLKNSEKGRNTAADRLDSVPTSLPALMYAQKVQKRAADYQFCYEDVAGAMADLDSEISELKAAVAGDGPKGHDAADEIGDVLFSAVNVARFLGADAEEALTASSRKFTARLKRAEALAAENGETLNDQDDAGRDALWRQAKAEEEGG